MKTRFLSVILLLTIAGASAAKADGLPFLRDNYAKGLAEAKQRKLPIFVDCWAPW
jgi:hypothetical protein